jgi:hypothetical protein
MGSTDPVPIGSSVYFWKAQIETGDIATDYIATTTTAVSVGPVSGLPRLDYYDSTCPRLLLEPQRTNTLAFSEQFDNAYFTKGASSITANAAISPSGYQDADKLVPDTSNAIHSVYRTGQTIIGGIYSVFAKADGYNWILLTSHFSSAPTFRGAFFNVSNGTIGTAAPGINAKIENYGNGWYRCSISEGNSPSTIWTVIPTNADNVTTFEGNGTDGVLIWGGQNEQGAYATSYIPTLGASVTRVADACSKTGISSLIGQTEGTLFIEGSALQNGSIDSRRISISDGSTNNRITIEWDEDSNRIRAFMSASGVTVGSTSYTGINQTNNSKIAVTYNSSAFSMFINGVKVDSDTTIGTTPTGMAQFNFSAEGGALPFQGNAKQLLIFPTALTDAQAIELTSL